MRKNQKKRRKSRVNNQVLLKELRVAKRMVKKKKRKNLNKKIHKLLMLPLLQSQDKWRQQSQRKLSSNRHLVTGASELNLICST
jgi:hypothetical protein